MRCDIREPYVLRAMSKACAQLMASKGYLNEDDRDDIADQIVAVHPPAKRVSMDLSRWPYRVQQ